MIHLTDDDVDRALAGADVEGVLRAAFVDLSHARAAQQARIRTDAGGVKLSTLGGVIPAQGVAGAKIYTTIAGQFNFLIALFSTTTGAPIATLAANAITRRRTAAVSLLAARAAGARGARIVVFGTGVQARAHAEAFAAAYPGATLRMLGRADRPEARAALADADIVITATRSATPLFDGDWVAPGAFVAAVGSSRPDTRETDDALLARSARVIVEWQEQALREAGDLLLANPVVRQALTIVDLGDVLAGKVAARDGADEIVLFKSVGVGIEDVAVAGLAYRQATGKAP